MTILYCLTIIYGLSHGMVFPDVTPVLIGLFYIGDCIWITGRRKRWED